MRCINGFFISKDPKLVCTITPNICDLSYGNALDSLFLQRFCF
uniref:Uncharacterized protein n=1 Tax=Tetranychus urticae TaxID=32264 RepID=T1K4P9_TETUR